MSKDCPTEETLVELLAGALPDETSSEVETHASSCTSCSAILAELARAETPSAGSAAEVVPDVPLTAGARIDRYVVLRRVGAGGMGLVYEAYDPKLERKVALKVLRPADPAIDAAPEGELSRAGVQLEERLVREAQAMARLAHPNVVAVHDVGSVGDRIFIAMEFVEGLTLRGWLAENKDRKAILARLKEAGEGLAAAHKAGIIHRDFKSENILIGPDGRARVTDFGLARVEATAKIARPISDDAATVTGTLLGTPAYMAPELFEGNPADERSDQWSFCVTLHEALLGARPSRDQHGAPKLSRDLKTLPPFLRAVLTRGLSAAPGDRYPSMAALLEALHHDPARAWRRRAIAGAVFATAIAAVAGYVTSARRHDELCSGAPSRMIGVWDDTRRAKLETVYRSSGLAYAADSWSRARAAIDEYSRAWVAMNTDTCVATRVRGEQSDAVLAVRMACLDRRLGELGAVVDVLSRADASVITRSAEVVGSMAPIATCENSQALLERVRPPDDPELRRKTEDIEKQIAEVRALTEAGKYAEGLELAKSAADAARAAGHGPTLTDALDARAILEEEDGDLKQAEATLREAYWAGDAAGHDAGAARAAVELVFVIGALDHRIDEAREWARHADAKIKRLGGDPHFEAALLQNLASTAASDGKPAEARKFLDQVLAIRERIQPDSHALSSTLNNIATIYRGEFLMEESIDFDRRAIRTLEHAAGPMHPDLISMHATLCDVYSNLSRYDEAHQECDKAFEIIKATVGPAHRDACGVSMAFGRLEAAQGHFKDALARFDDATLCFQATLGPEHPFVADAISMSGELSARMHDNASAKEKLLRALAILEKTYGEDDEQLADALTQLGGTLIEMKDDAGARQALGHAIRIYEKVDPSSKFQAAYPHTALGELDLRENRADRALPHLEEAEKLLADFGHDKRGLASTQITLARAILATKGDRDRARKLAEAAVKFYEQTPDHPDAADAREFLATSFGGK